MSEERPILTLIQRGPIRTFISMDDKTRSRIVSEILSDVAVAVTTSTLSAVISNLIRATLKAAPHQEPLIIFGFIRDGPVRRIIRRLATNI